MLAAPWRSAALGVTMTITAPFAAYCQAAETRSASTPATTAEELVYARADDGIVDAGALFTPRGSVDGRIAQVAQVLADWVKGVVLAGR